MSEWEVVGVIVVLVGLVATIIKPITTLTKSITQLTVTVETLDVRLEKNDSNNTRSHERIWEELDDHKNHLSEHDTELALQAERLQSIENKRK